MEPLTIAGALIGAILNKILPEQVVVFLLVLLLSFTAYTTLSKAISMYRKETKQMAKQQLSTTTTTTSQAQLSNLTKLSQMAQDQEAQEALLDHVELSQINDDQYEEELVQSMTNHEKQHNSTNNYKTQRELQQIIQEERDIPLSNVTVIVALFLVILIINVLKGGGAFSSPLGIVCGSTSFWVANATMLLWILLLIFFGRAYLIHRYHLKKRCHYTYVEGDIQWNERATIIYPFICCFAGFFSGMFGIGGGIVKGKRKKIIRK